MYNWTGKKLLVLGATNFQCEIVKTAQKFGAKVVVIDYNENSPAKKLADENYLINAVDVDRVVNLIKAKNIDGVLTGFADSLLPAYKEICNKSNLPCYITNNEQITFTLEKTVFKDYLKRFGIPYIKDLKENDNKDFPLIVKPVDNSGARGISIAHDEEELKTSIALALDNSKSKKYIIEKYLTYPEATVFYLFVEGKAYFTLMGNRCVAPVKDGFIKLPTGYIFPAKASEKFERELHPKFQKMFEELNIENGMMFIQGFVDEENTFIPYEPGFRLTGSLEYILLEKVQGYNPLAMMINYALTGKMNNGNELARISPLKIKKCYNISCLITPGEIKKIEGIDILKKTKGIKYVFLSYKEGDILTDDNWGKLSQIGVRIFVVPDNELQYEQIQETIRNNLKVISKDNNNMIINFNIEL